MFNTIIMSSALLIVVLRGNQNSFIPQISPLNWYFADFLFIVRPIEQLLVCWRHISNNKTSNNTRCTCLCLSFLLFPWPLDPSNILTSIHPLVSMSINSITLQQVCMRALHSPHLSTKLTLFYWHSIFPFRYTTRSDLNSHTKLKSHFIDFLTEEIVFDVCCQLACIAILELSILSLVCLQ